MRSRAQEAGADSSAADLSGQRVRADGADRSPRRPAWPSILCGLLALLVLGLSVRNRGLAAQVRELTSQLRRSEQRPLGRGMIFPSVELLDSRGRSVAVAVRPGEQGVLLLVSSPACGACDEVRDEWNRVTDSASRRGVRVMELVLGADQEALATSSPDSTAHVFAPGPDSQAFTQNLPAVPAAILIGVNGVVQTAVYGTPHDGLTAAVEGFQAN